MSELDLLAKQVGSSARTLRRAVNEGTLRGKRCSPRRLKLSAAEKDYVLGKWSFLAQLRAALRTEPNVRFALLFGSTARGEDTDASDVDLVVEVRDSSLVRLIDLEFKLEVLLGRKVDLLSLTEAESNPLLLGGALLEGRVIVDREDRWSELYAQAARSERREEIVGHLEEFPIQLLALESAMEEFGDDFDVAEFKLAFEGKPNIKAYNRVQAVERAFARVQNYIVQLAESGSMLAGLELPETHEGAAARIFDALREAGVITASVAKNLKRAQRARSAIEHDYVKVTAGRVHEAVELGLAAARSFIGPYAAWIEPYLE